jgi:hypothetical protein
VFEYSRSPENLREPRKLSSIVVQRTQRARSAQDKNFAALPFDFAQGGELAEPCSLCLRDPTWDGYSRPTICDLCVFVVRSLLPFGCGFAALGSF